MIELVIFDCDGVLVDSEMIAARVTADLLGELGAEISCEDVLTAFAGLDADATLRCIESDYGIALPQDFNDRDARNLELAFRAELQPMAGVMLLLQKLDVPFCVASNSSHARLRQTFLLTGLAPLVEGGVFSADDVTRGKPAPDLFWHAAARMGDIPADRCLVIEDSIVGVTAARVAGMRVIGFCGGSHIRTGHDLRLRALGAETVVSDHDALGAYLPLTGDVASHRTA
ncbi:HAD family hydrolase [Mesorhizobium sp. AaZ16]|uniref:HAD family hydrolase n=1 Tax=Mesorhizobium sp. AaZ16 TaxID=3402289 RepID=UPI00374ED7FE